MVATLPSRKIADSESAASFRRGWDERNSRSVQIPPVRRASGIYTASGFHGTGTGVERGGSDAKFPSGGSNWSDSEQAFTDRSSGDYVNTGLATTNVE